MKLIKRFLIKSYYYYLKLMGLCPFDVAVPECELKFSLPGLIYNALLVVLYSYSFLNIFVNRLDIQIFNETGLTVIMDALTLQLQNFAVVTFWILAMVRLKDARTIFEAVADCENCRRELAMTSYLDERYLHVTLRFVAINAVYFGICIIDYLYLIKNARYKERSGHWLVFGVCSVDVFVIYALFIEFMLYVEYYCGRANEELLILSLDPIVDVDDCVVARVSRRLASISKLQRSLRDAMQLVTRFIGVPVTFVMIAHFLSLFTELYYIYQVLKSMAFDDYVEAFLVSSFWLCTKFMVTYLLCSIADSTCVEVNLSMRSRAGVLPST
ncbi:hypothetical protein TKK_0002804 [Trichogramma kaykai]